MLNQLILVGRLARQPELKETDKKKKYSHITLAVPRSFKNMDGNYDTDFIDCTLWDNAAKNTVEYCNCGDVIGIRGRLQSNVYEKEGKKVYSLEVVVEKITFLTSKEKTNNKNEG